jgi:signal transduction histidine kinase
MEERAALAGGKLELRTAPGQGTVLLATFPMTMEQAA